MVGLKSEMKRIQANESRPVHKGGSRGGSRWDRGCAGWCYRKRFWLQPCCHRQRLPILFFCLHKDGVCFTQHSLFVSFPSPAWGWTPWCHKRHARTRGFPLLEKNPKLLPPVAKHRLRKCFLVTPSHSVQAIGHSIFQLQAHFLSKDSKHLLRGCSGMAFPPPPSGAPRQKAQAVLWAEPQAGQDRPVGITSQLHSALLLSVLVLGHNSVLFTELRLCTALCWGLRGRRQSTGISDHSGIPNSKVQQPCVGARFQPPGTTSRHLSQGGLLPTTCR